MGHIGLCWTDVSCVSYTGEGWTPFDARNPVAIPAPPTAPSKLVRRNWRRVSTRVASERSSASDI